MEEFLRQFIAMNQQQWGDVDLTEYPCAEHLLSPLRLVRAVGARIEWIRVASKNGLFKSVRAERDWQLWGAGYSVGQMTIANMSGDYVGELIISRHAEAMQEIARQIETSFVVDAPENSNPEHFRLYTLENNWLLPQVFENKRDRVIEVLIMCIGAFQWLLDGDYPKDELPFIRTIIENGRDSGPRLVYADYLEETGQCVKAGRIRELVMGEFANVS